MKGNIDTFDWYKFYEVGCKLLESESEEDLRTAINRFYYGAFCYSRDYLINNKIYYDKKHKEDLLSDKGIVHVATREIFLKETNKINHSKGKKIHDWLYNLRKYRNKVDYDRNSDFNLKYMVKVSEIYSKKIFVNIDSL